MNSPPNDEFAGLTAPELVKRCHKMADEASALAENARPNFRHAYALLAFEWLILADEIAREALGLL